MYGHLLIPAAPPPPSRHTQSCLFEAIHDQPPAASFDLPLALPSFCSVPSCCPQKCPFEAIMIINLPKDLDGHTTHRYGPNSFKLHR